APGAREAYARARTGRCIDRAAGGVVDVPLSAARARRSRRIPAAVVRRARQRHLRAAAAARRMRRALEPPFAVGALAVIVFAVWLAKDAGYAPATWYTGGLFLVALAAVAFVAY